VSSVAVCDRWHNFVHHVLELVFAASPQTLSVTQQCLFCLISPAKVHNSIGKVSCLSGFGPGWCDVQSRAGCLVRPLLSRPTIPYYGLIIVVCQGRSCVAVVASTSWEGLFVARVTQTTPRRQWVAFHDSQLMLPCKATATWPVGQTAAGSKRFG